ncbi:MAG: hypothetical protein R3C53_01935 [Pirellulaceae bacterium]
MTTFKMTPLLSLAMLAITACLISLTSVGQERIARPEPTSDRETQVAFELDRLRDALSGMGERHPQLKATQQRISELQAEMVALSRGAGPFAEALAADKADVDKLLRQMSDAELRQAVLHLFAQVKDLERRVDRLER